MEMDEAAVARAKATHERERAKDELLEIIVDKSTLWRGRMYKTIGTVWKSSVLDDPDMWPWVRSAAKSALDHMWSDIEHEIERSIQTAVQKQQRDANEKGPSGEYLLGYWYAFRAFSLNHFLPHNKSIFGKLKDPVYLVMYCSMLIPIHGVRVVLLALLLIMLLFPAPPNEFQLINFILMAKGYQFLTSGLMQMAKAAMSYFWCHSFHKGALLECMDHSVPTSAGTLGQGLDYFGTSILVWIAFLALPYSSKIDATGDYEEVGVDAENSDRPQDEEQGCCGGLRTKSGQGGRLRKLLNYDIRCLCISLIVLIVLSLATALLGAADMQRMDSDPQFRSNVFWCCVLYSVLSFPFFVFTIPGLQNILTHSVLTGYNEHGACVAFELSALPPSEEVEPVGEQEEEDPGVIGRWASTAVRIVRTIERGQEYRGNPNSPYQFGDFSRGLWAKWTGQTRGKKAGQTRPSQTLSAEVDPCRQQGMMSAMDSILEEADFGPGLDVTSTSVVEVVKSDQGHYCFVIDVQPHVSLDGEGTLDAWQVTRRYREFRSLAGQLGKSCQFADAPFPSRAVFSRHSDDMMEKRRQALDIWLRKAVQHPLAQTAWSAPLRAFLSTDSDLEQNPSGSTASLDTHDLSTPLLLRDALVDSTSTGSHNEGVAEKGLQRKITYESVSRGFWAQMSFDRWLRSVPSPFAAPAPASVPRAVLKRGPLAISETVPEAADEGQDEIEEQVRPDVDAMGQCHAEAAGAASASFVRGASSSSSSPPCDATAVVAAASVSSTGDCRELVACDTDEVTSERSMSVVNSEVVVPALLGMEPPPLERADGGSSASGSASVSFATSERDAT